MYTRWLYGHRIIMCTSILFNLFKSLGWDPQLMIPPYDNLRSLLNRSTWIGVSFIIELLNGEVNSPLFVNKLNISVPSQCSRRYVLIKLSQCWTNYELRFMDSKFNQYLTSANHSIGAILGLGEPGLHPFYVPRNLVRKFVNLMELA